MFLEKIISIVKRTTALEQSREPLLRTSWSQPVKFVFPVGPMYRASEEPPVARERARTDEAGGAAASFRSFSQFQQSKRTTSKILMKTRIIEGNPNRYAEALGDLFPEIDLWALEALGTPQAALEFLGQAMALGADKDLHDEAFWEKVKEQGPEEALRDIVKDFLRIPGNALRGRSAVELLQAATKRMQFGREENDTGFYQDVENLTDEELLDKYFPDSGDNSDSSSHSSGSNTGSTSGSSGTGSTSGSTTGRPGSDSGIPSSGSSGSGTSSGSSGTSSSPSQPGSTPSGSGSTPSGSESGSSESSSGSSGSSSGWIEVNIFTGEWKPVPDPNKSSSSSGSSSGSSGSSDNSSNDSDDSADDSSSPSDSSSNDADDANANGVDQGQQDQDESIPDPQRTFKTWAEMSPEERQIFLLIIQAEWNLFQGSFVNPGPDGSGTSTVTWVDFRDEAMADPRYIWRQKLAPYIYPVEDSGESPIPLPNGAGSAVFGVGDLVDTLPDPPDPDHG